jgi:superfamily II DNA or RNA helicase
MYPNLEVGIIGDGKCEVKDVNIATIWSAASAFNKKINILDADLTYDKKDVTNKAKVQKAIKEAKLFILDECQYAAANTVQFIHRASINAKHRFLFSASPWRDSGDEILIEAVGGNRIYDLPASKLIEEGYLVRPEIHFLDVPVMRKVGKTYQEVYSNYIVNNDKRNDLIISSAKKLISSGKKVLILVVRVGHGNILLKKMKGKYRVDFLDGQNTSKQRLETIEKMKSGEIDVLIASKIFDQGVDIPQLDALILAGSGKSSGRALQRIGRVIRKNEGKVRAIVVDFYDNAKYLRDHSEVRKKVYETEPSFVIKFPKLKEFKKYPKRKKIDWSSN